MIESWCETLQGSKEKLSQTRKTQDLTPFRKPVIFIAIIICILLETPTEEKKQVGDNTKIEALFANDLKYFYHLLYSKTNPTKYEYYHFFGNGSEAELNYELFYCKENNLLPKKIEDENLCEKDIIVYSLETLNKGKEDKLKRESVYFANLRKYRTIFGEYKEVVIETKMIKKIESSDNCYSIPVHFMFKHTKKINLKYIYCLHDPEEGIFSNIFIDGFNMDDILYTFSNVKLNNRDINSNILWEIKPSEEIKRHFESTYDINFE